MSYYFTGFYRIWVPSGSCCGVSYGVVCLNFKHDEVAQVGLFSLLVDMGRPQATP